jgi:membrane associated rhomboid family serine protease
MDGRPPMSLAFPKPGRALTAVMALMAVVGIASAFLLTWASAGLEAFRFLGCDRLLAFRQPWRLLTSGLLTDPTHWSHLALSLVGLYFLGAPLERRWGAWRFLRFLALSVILGNLTTIAVAAVVGPGGQARFHPDFVFGPAAMITGVAIAWSREYADATVNLLFILPVRGKVLLWVTIGFCVLDLVYPAGMPEGVVAPFGGVIAGLLFGGTPSLVRSAWLQLRLALLRRRSGGMRVKDVLTPKAPRRPRPGAPPLRVVPGGLEDVLKKRTPPKDKRYLN